MRVGSPLRWEGDCGAERDSGVQVGGREGSLLPERRLAESTREERRRNPLHLRRQGRPWRGESPRGERPLGKLNRSPRRERTLGESKTLKARKRTLSEF
jgi:hypothetical protein